MPTVGHGSCTACTTRRGDGGHLHAHGGPGVAGGVEVLHHQVEARRPRPGLGIVADEQVGAAAQLHHGEALRRWKKYWHGAEVLGQAG